MSLSEAEIQVLASICATQSGGQATDRASIDARGDGYWKYKEDWSDAYDALIDKGLLRYENAMYHLTDSGRPLAEQYHSERPDMYWYYYQMFYTTARASAVYSVFCEKVFGHDLCQDGQTDMVSLDHLLALLNLREGDRVLDVGCGAGMISEYISDETGAHVTGIDYSARAINEANARTTAKRHRLDFTQGNFNTLDLEAASYNAVISIDTLYWASDLEATLSRLLWSLKPGGQMGIFMNHHAEQSDPDLLAVENSDTFRALRSLNLPVNTFDYTQNVKRYWRRVYSVVTELKGDFESEGNGDIADRLIHECENDYLPDVENDRIARYLFHVQNRA